MGNFGERDQCRGDDGATTLLGAGSYDCTDGSKLLWNDMAWWTSTEAVFHSHARDDGQLIPPDTKIAKCQNGS